MIINCYAVKTKNSFDSQKAKRKLQKNQSVKRNPGNSVPQMYEWFFRLYRKSWKMENVNFASAFLIHSRFAWDCRDSFKSSHASRHILYEADAALYSLLAVFWFSTSSSIASLRFSGGGGAFAFVILNSSLSTIFHCRCSGSSIVTRGVAVSQSMLMHLGCSFAANYQPGKPSDDECTTGVGIIVEIQKENNISWNKAQWALNKKKRSM